MIEREIIRHFTAKEIAVFLGLTKSIVNHRVAQLKLTPRFSKIGGGKNKRIYTDEDFYLIENYNPKKYGKSEANAIRMAMEVIYVHTIFEIRESKMNTQ